MAPASGWYPDPGKSGKFRYWDGQYWSAALSDAPASQQPSGAGPAANSYPSSAGTSNPYLRDDGQESAESSENPAGPTRRTAWWIVGGVVALAVVVGLGFGLRQLMLPAGMQPTGSSHSGPPPQEQICPPQSGLRATPPAQTVPGRVTAGNLSYAQLPRPWGIPQAESRVPFTQGAVSQTVVIHENYTEFNNWVASVTLAALYTGDGFYEPERGAEIVVKCVVGTFYGTNTDVNRKDLRSEAIKVDGHNAWVIESNLSFDIPNLATKSELLIVVVVDTQDGGAGLFYASIPGDAMQLEGAVRQAMKTLKVEK